jgi:Co/Zn/Cd efflux system component
MLKTTFAVRKMDCTSEEQLIRLKLQAFENISSLAFNMPTRRLEVYHTGDYRPILEAINDLRLDGSFICSSAANEPLPEETHRMERRLLLQVLSINAFFFLLELLTGVIFNSMGLVADGLDMLADSFVYGLALFVVGGTAASKMRIAKTCGCFQLILAFIGIAEVSRRFLGFGEIPAFQAMILVSILALIGNVAGLLLLQKSKSTEAHMQASMICTSNDVVINFGVIVAGILVFITNSKIPDLFVGTIVFLLVVRGAYRILQIAR